MTEYESVLKENDPNFGLNSEQEIAHDSFEWYQLHLATERIRVPEILFQVNKHLPRLSSSPSVLFLVFRIGNQVYFDYICQSYTKD